MTVTHTLPKPLTGYQRRGYAQRSLLLFACCSLLTACAVGPDYERPEVNAPENFRSASTETPASAAPALETEAWGEGFNDPVLNQLVSTGLENNRDLQTAIARVRRARGNLITTRGQFFPQINYGGGGERGTAIGLGQSAGASSTTSLLNIGNATLSAGWQLDLFGGLRRQYEAASANEAAAIANRQATALSVAGEVVNVYITLRSLDRQLAVARETLRIYKESLHIFELRFRYGTANMVQLSQVQSQVDSAEAAIPPLVRAVGEQENNLNFLLGQNPGPVPRGKSIAQLVLPLPPVGLPAQLLERRPDVRVAEQQLIATNAQIGAVKAQFFPNISLTGTLGSASTPLSNLFSAAGNVWTAGFAIAGPLFRGGEIYGQYVGARADQQAAFTDYLKAVEGAFRDTDTALIATTESRKLVKARQQQVGTLQTYSRLSNMQFNYGYADYLTVLSAENSLFQAQLDLARSQADQAIAQVGLYMALGGGWAAADAKTMAANKAIAEGKDPRNPANK